MKNCNRRSFISKNVYSSMGFLLGFPFISSSNVFCLREIYSKEKIYKQLDEIVDKNFLKLENCAQTSFHALNQVFNLQEDNLIKALASFSGIAFRGETCGAVSGCLLGIGLVYEKNSNNQDKQRPSTGPSIKFCSYFESNFGSIRCRDVINKMTNKEFQISKLEDYGLLSKEGAFDNCPIVIKKALHIAADIILERSNG